MEGIHRALLKAPKCLENISRRVQFLKRKARRKPSRGTDEDMTGWSNLQVLAGKVVDSTFFEVLVCCVVVANLLLIVFETDLGVACHGQDHTCVPAGYAIANHILLAFYTLELAVQVYVQRSTYLWFGWNLLDASIVSLGYFELVMFAVSQSQDGFALVRFLKVARIVRIARILKPIPELYKLVNGFFSTVRTMFWGFLMIIVLLSAWAVITVQILTPLTDVRGQFEVEWCNTAFESVSTAIVLYFQTLIAGDSWGLCVVPALQKRPELFWLFSAVLVTVQLGFTNLILAVIVESSADSRATQQSELRAQEQRQRAETIAAMHDILHRLDADNSGVLTINELEEGYDHDEQLNAKFSSLGISKNDLSKLFTAMDHDGSGDVTYDEFIESLLWAEKDARAQSLNLHLKLEYLTSSVDNRFAELAQILTGHSPGHSPVKQQKQSCPGSALQEALSAALLSSSAALEYLFRESEERLKNSLLSNIGPVNANKIFAHGSPIHEGSSQQQEAFLANSITTTPASLQSTSNNNNLSSDYPQSSTTVQEVSVKV